MDSNDPVELPIRVPEDCATSSFPLPTVEGTDGRNRSEEGTVRH